MNSMYDFAKQNVDPKFVEDIITVDMIEEALFNNSTVKNTQPSQLNNNYVNFRLNATVKRLSSTPRRFGNSLADTEDKKNIHTMIFDL